MSLIKGPFLIKFDDMVVNHVTKIVYADGKLGIDILISDYDEANFLLDNLTVRRVYCFGCSNKQVGVTYTIKKYKTGIILEDNTVAVLRVICDVTRVRIGEIDTRPRFAQGGLVNCKEPIHV